MDYFYICHEIDATPSLGDDCRIVSTRHALSIPFGGVIPIPRTANPCVGYIYPTTLFTESLSWKATTVINFEMSNLRLW